MSLVAAVGLLNLFHNSPEQLVRFEEQIKSVRVTTVSEGYGGSDELEFPPEKSDLVYWQPLSRQYSFELLRRMAAHLLSQGKLPDPADPNSIDDPSNDPVFVKFMKSGGLANRKLLERSSSRTSRSFTHLAAHNGVNGYYSPRQFEEILEPAAELNFEGGMLPSAPKLALELQKIADALQLPLGLSPDLLEVSKAIRSWTVDCVGWKRYPLESQALLALYHGAIRSFETQRTLALIDIQ